MRCAACGTELIAGKKFCHACGTRVAVQCRGCGASIGPDFRFCPDCGLEASGGVHDAAPPPADDPLSRLSEHIPTALAHKIRATQGVIEGERKQVTVLFCDLAGSTAIAERFDPEDYHDLLDRYLELAFAQIYRYEGIVNQIAGDGLMALFGAPVAHEDAPQRAVLAALGIHEALADFRFARLAEQGLVLQARVGVHTGPVVVGTVGNDLKMDYTAIGDTTNLASRLESLAEPGTTLVSEATQRLVRGLFEVRPTGPLAVKGKRERVVAYQVLGATQAATPMTIAAERGLTPFVGRAEELAQLDAGWRRLAGNVAQVVAIVGQAGSGKSRLLYEFRQRLATEGAVFLEGRCSTLSQAVPYFPFITMFRNYFDLVPGDTPDTACAKVTAKVDGWREKPELTRRLVSRLLSLPFEHEEGGEGLKRESFDAIAQLLLAESERGPVVVVLEDLHSVDEGSRELLESLVARLANARVMVVVTQRPEEQAAWRAEATFTQLVLHRLSDDEVRAIIRAVARGALPAELEALLVAKAEGSPFFAEEITRTLVEEGWLTGENGTRRLTRPLEDIRIPGTVQEVIAARLDRLAPQAKRVVQVAAVLGRQFRAGQLTTLLDGEGIDVARELAQLERAGVVHRKHLLASDEYRFGESLTQEVAYEGLLLRQRRQLHERVALLLEASPAEATAERSALVAHHFARSDNRPRAVDALLRAAQEAERLPSYRTAAEFFRQAWEQAEAEPLDTADESFRRAALTAVSGFCRVTVLFGLPFVAEAERAAERGRRLAEGLGDAEALAGLYYFQGALTISRGRDHFARGLELAEQGLAAAERAGLTIPTMRIARGLCVNYVLDGRFELARRTADWTIDGLERSGDHERFADLYVSALWVRDIVRYLSDDLDAALAGATETHARAVSVPNRTVRSGSAGTLAQIHFFRGEYAEAMRWADESLEIAEAIANPAGFPAAAAVALASRLELGEPVAAAHYLELIEQGVAVAAGSQLNIRFVGDALLAVGDQGRLEWYVQQLRGAAGGRLREALVATSMGEVLARLGRHDEAERRYREAIGLAEAIGARSTLGVAALGAAELAALRGERAASERYLAWAITACRELRLGRYEPRIAQLQAASEGTVARPV